MRFIFNCIYIMNDVNKTIRIRVKINKINCNENISSMNTENVEEIIHLAEQKVTNKTQKKKKTCH